MNSKPALWWSNTILFCSIHIIGLTAFQTPLSNSKPLLLLFLNWQLATLGITIGYHRLWSHRSFEARLPLRIVLACAGTLGFQGSIKWWVLRHRLHHRFTDNKTSDPYAASRGLFFSHMGWIFRKAHYEKIKLVDQTDLNSDPVVQFQHKYFIPLAILSGLVLPAIVGYYWIGGAYGAWMGYLYGGILARIAIWHCTFLINSLAHYIGERVYALDISARGTLLLALLTNGEGYHNFHHTFPYDYRNGIKPLDWDPSKWIIWLLHVYTNQVPVIRRAKEDEILKARARVALEKGHILQANDSPDCEVIMPKFTKEEMFYAFKDKQILILDGYIIDVYGFAKEHPGGEKLIVGYYGKDATKAFSLLTHHSSHALSLVKEKRIAKIC